MINFVTFHFQFSIDIDSNAKFCEIMANSKYECQWSSSMIEWKILVCLSLFLNPRTFINEFRSQAVYIAYRLISILSIYEFGLDLIKHFRRNVTHWGSQDWNLDFHSDHGHSCLFLLTSTVFLIAGLWQRCRICARKTGKIVHLPGNT
jgi:hypothetical protein